MDVNRADEDGHTALIWAADKGSEEVRHTSLSPSCTVCYKVVDLLLERPELELNSQDGDGFTALYCAAKLDNPTVLTALLARPGIQVNFQVGGCGRFTRLLNLYTDCCRTQKEVPR